MFASEQRSRRRLPEAVIPSAPKHLAARPACPSSTPPLAVAPQPVSRSGGSPPGDFRWPRCGQTVSEASIIRFSRTIGFQGIRDLRPALAAETAGPLQEIHGDIQAVDMRCIDCSVVALDRSNTIVEAHRLDERAIPRSRPSDTVMPDHVRSLAAGAISGRWPAGEYWARQDAREAESLIQDVLAAH